MARPHGQAAAGRVETIAGPVAPQLQAVGRFAVETAGECFVDVTAPVAGWIAELGANAGLAHVFVRHSSASLAIQENADPDVRTDLLNALGRLAPEDAFYHHDIEGPDDMPAHIRAMLTASSLAVPVVGGRLGLGTWQAIYLIEHRRHPHRREILTTFSGV